MAARVKVFPCAQCGSNVTVRAAGLSLTVACASCGTIFDTETGELSQLREAAMQSGRSKRLTLPLGSRGSLDGAEWEVIAWMSRRDVRWSFCWEEYLLFNPYHGFSFLICSDDGHWAVAYPRAARPLLEGREKELSLDGHELRLYHRGRACVDAVLGEFYWHVRPGDTTTYSEYIVPPLGLSVEIEGGGFSESPKGDDEGAQGRPAYTASYRRDDRDDDDDDDDNYGDPDDDVPEEVSVGEVIVSESRYLTQAELRAAFPVLRNASLKRPSNLGHLQPNSASTLVRGMFLPWLGVVVAAIVLFIHFSRSARNELLVDVERVFHPSEREVDVRIADVTIPEGGSNLMFTSRSAVSNSWVEVEYSVEPLDGGTQAVSARTEVAYYFGRDSDGSWSEGSQKDGVVLAPLPAGRYALLASVSAADFSNGQPVTVRMQSKGGVPIVWPILFMVVVVSLPFWLVSVASQAIERKRWSESDYSPYSD